MENANTFVFLPSEDINDLKQLAKDVREVLAKLNNGTNTSALGDWIPESEAQKILGRKTTWFYNKRISGELTGKKRGGKWWYAKSEILKFIEG